MDKPASIKRRRGTRQLLLGSAWREETVWHWCRIYELHKTI